MIVILYTEDFEPIIPIDLPPLRKIAMARWYAKNTFGYSRRRTCAYTKPRVVAWSTCPYSTILEHSTQDARRTNQTNQKKSELTLYQIFSIIIYY